MTASFINDLISISFNIVDQYVCTFDHSTLIFNLCKFDRALHIYAGDMYNVQSATDVLYKLGLTRNIWEFRVIKLIIELRGNIVHVKSAKDNDVQAVLQMDNFGICMYAIKKWVSDISNEINFITEGGRETAQLEGIIIERSRIGLELSSISSGNKILVKRSKR